MQENNRLWYLIPATLFLLSACVDFQLVGEVQRGRTALLGANPDAALAHFQRAAEQNPDYFFNYYPLEQSVQTYLGRAYYATGNLPAARQVLERARSRYKQDQMAKLYLGLVLSRDGDRQRGLRELQAGLQGLIAWLDSMQQIPREAIYWDPGGDLRSEAQRSLAMIAGRDINWKELIASAERLGQQFDEEVDRARYDERRDRDTEIYQSSFQGEPGSSLDAGFERD